MSRGSWSCRLKRRLYIYSRCMRWMLNYKMHHFFLCSQAPTGNDHLKSWRYFQMRITRHAFVIEDNASKTRDRPFSTSIYIFFFNFLTYPFIIYLHVYLILSFFFSAKDKKYRREVKNDLPNLNANARKREWVRITSIDSLNMVIFLFSTFLGIYR